MQRNQHRWPLALLALSLCACREPPPPPGPDPAEVALRETVARADAMSERIEEILEPIPLMRPGEEEELRRYLADVHLRRARALGVRAGDRETIEALAAEGRSSSSRTARRTGSCAAPEAGRRTWSRTRGRS